MKEALLRDFSWHGAREDIANYVAHCEQCQRCKPSTKRKPGLLQPLPIPPHPWHTVTTDFITCLPTTSKGHDAVLVFVDKLTKMTHLVPTSVHCTAAEFAGHFLREVVRLHGFPAVLISDRDPRFTSRFWTAVAYELELKRAMSTAFHPQSDGQTERMNREIEAILRTYVNPQGNDWDSHLDMVEFAINTHVNASTKQSPFMLNYGRHPLTPATMLNKHKATRPVEVPAAGVFTTSMQEALRKAKVCIQAAADRQKAAADTSRRDLTFKVGESVLLSTTNLKLATDKPRKLLPKWVGPFSVVKVINAVAYQLALPDNWTIHDVFHISLLKPYLPGKTSKVPPPPEFINDQAEYEVERILAHRRVGRSHKYQYLIQWRGYSEEHISWEPETNMTNCHELLDVYWKNVQSAEAHNTGAKHMAKSSHPSLTKGT